MEVLFFDINKFYTGLESCINRGKFRATQDKTTNQRLQDTFSVATIDDFFALISGAEQIACEGEVDEQGAIKK